MTQKTTNRLIQGRLSVWVILYLLYILFSWASFIAQAQVSNEQLVSNWILSTFALLNFASLIQLFLDWFGFRFWTWDYSFTRPSKATCSDLIFFFIIIIINILPLLSSPSSFLLFSARRSSASCWPKQQHQQQLCTIILQKLLQKTKKFASLFMQ